MHICGVDETRHCDCSSYLTFFACYFTTQGQPLGPVVAKYQLPQESFRQNQHKLDPKVNRGLQDLKTPFKGIQKRL